MKILPFHIAWLATNQCNASCQHCSSNAGMKNKDELEKKEVFHLLDGLHEAGVVDIGISGGEPLLREDIIQIIEYAVKLNFSIGIGSHGGNLNIDILKKIKKSGVNRLQVSLDGFAEEHDRLRAWPGLFNRVVKSISYSLDIGLKTNVCFTINKLNYNILPKFIDYISSIGIKKVNISRFVPTGRGADFLDLTNEEWAVSIKQVAVLKQKYKEKIEIVSHLSQYNLTEENSNSIYSGCQAGRRQGCISSDGTVFPCVLLPIPIGNIRDKSFVEIWTQSSIINLLQERKHLQGHCGVCVNKMKCGGCRAVAYAKTGNFLSADPRCYLHLN